MRPSYLRSLTLNRFVSGQTTKYEAMPLLTRLTTSQWWSYFGNFSVRARPTVTVIRRKFASGPSGDNRLPSASRPAESEASKSPPQTFVDPILRTASSLSRQLNIYTGTDYTPIQALRERIGEQEINLKNLSSAFNKAKAAQDVASNERIASQKELLRLLERKSSWTDADLERYMSLVRDEHVTDQKVSETRMRVEQAEKEVEECRGGLERLERRLYHEEQIWSDTIRRNSTWVTFGLMGVNVLLLLIGLVVIEPWRRRRLVNEIGKIFSLDETASPQSPPTKVILPAGVETQVNEVIEDAEMSIKSSSIAISPQTYEEESEFPGEAKTLSWKSMKSLSLADIRSQELVQMSVHDLSVLVATGAAVGATLSWLVGAMIRNR